MSSAKYRFRALVLILSAVSVSKTVWSLGYIELSAISIRHLSLFSSMNRVRLDCNTRAWNPPSHPDNRRGNLVRSNFVRLITMKGWLSKIASVTPATENLLRHLPSHPCQVQSHRGVSTTMTRTHRLRESSRTSGQ